MHGHLEPKWICSKNYGKGEKRKGGVQPFFLKPNKILQLISILSCPSRHLPAQILTIETLEQGAKYVQS